MKNASQIGAIKVPGKFLVPERKVRFHLIGDGMGMAEGVKL